MEFLEKVLIMAGVAILFNFCLIFLINNTLKEQKLEEKNSVSYMEKAGIGVVIGKRLKGKYNDPEVAIQFKDTILYSENKEWYYLLKEGDSIQVKEGKIIKKN